VYYVRGTPVESTASSSSLESENAAVASEPPPRTRHRTLCIQEGAVHYERGIPVGCISNPRLETGNRTSSSSSSVSYNAGKVLEVRVGR